MEQAIKTKIYLVADYITHENAEDTAVQWWSLDEPEQAETRSYASYDATFTGDFALVEVNGVKRVTYTYKGKEYEGVLTPSQSEPRRLTLVSPDIRSDYYRPGMTAPKRGYCSGELIFTTATDEPPFVGSKYPTETANPSDSEWKNDRQAARRALPDSLNKLIDGIDKTELVSLINQYIDLKTIHTVTFNVETGKVYAVEGYPQKDSEYPVMVCGGFFAPLTAKSPEIINADKALHYLRKTIASAIGKGEYKTDELLQADAAREARLKYEREWRAKNKDKVKARQARYWAKKAKTTK